MLQFIKDPLKLSLGGIWWKAVLHNCKCTTVEQKEHWLDVVNIYSLFVKPVWLKIWRLKALDDLQDF